jgi:hypothetical protein
MPTLQEVLYTMKPQLKIDWATHEAAKYAVENWHYSRTLPVGKMAKIGAWEDGKFVGVVIFAWGMNKDLGSPYGLKLGECAELVRVALTKHQSEVSKILAIAIRFLKKQSPGLRLLVSFADPSEGHHGGIYQANGWQYAGTSPPSVEWLLNGKRLNRRAYTGHNFGQAKMQIPKGAIKRKVQGKHRYLMPLDNEMRKSIMPLAKPYPKRASSETSDTSAIHAEKGGATPTDALQSDDL